MFQWEAKYSVGIQSIDNQHKEIFRYLDKLLEAMKQGQASHVINEIVLELEKYARNHFQKEEYFFGRFNYPETDSHVAEHQNFNQKIALFKTDLKNSKNVSSFDLLNFLKEWIEHHILEVDKQYSECFRQNGLQ